LPGFAQETVLRPEGFSRKGAKTQSAAAFLKVFLCTFAPLRETCFRGRNAERFTLPVFSNLPDWIVKLDTLKEGQDE
jgi:hypothetical protein